MSAPTVIPEIPEEPNFSLCVGLGGSVAFQLTSASEGASVIRTLLGLATVVLERERFRECYRAGPRVNGQQAGGALHLSMESTRAGILDHYLTAIDAGVEVASDRVFVADCYTWKPSKRLLETRGASTDGALAGHRWARDVGGVGGQWQTLYRVGYWRAKLDERRGAPSRASDSGFVVVAMRDEAAIRTEETERRVEVTLPKKDAPEGPLARTIETKECSCSAAGRTSG